MGNSKMSTKIITVVFILFMLSALNCGKLKGSLATSNLTSNFDQQAKGIMSTLEDSKHYFEEKLSNEDLSDEQTATIFGKAEKKLKKVTDSAIAAWKKFDNVLSKANETTKEHMEEVHQKITKKIQGIEMELGDFAGKKFNEVAKRIMSNLNNSTEYFVEMLSNRTLTDEQLGADFEKAQKKLHKVTDFALDAWKIFENVLQKANNSTREHMNAVHQKITRRIQGIEMKVRDFAEEIKHAKKEAKREKKAEAKIETEFLQGDKNIDKEAELIGADLNKFQQNFQKELDNEDSTEEQVEAILEKGEKDLEHIIDLAKGELKKFDGIFKKANNSTQEHMKKVFHRIADRLHDAEKKVGKFNHQFQIERKERHAEAEAKEEEAKEEKPEAKKEEKPAKK